MIYNVISCLCTGIFLCIATTELLTQKLKSVEKLFIISVITVNVGRKYAWTLGWSDCSAWWF